MRLTPTQRCKQDLARSGDGGSSIPGTNFFISTWSMSLNRTRWENLPAYLRVSKMVPGMSGSYAPAHSPVPGARTHTHTTHRIEQPSIRRYIPVTPSYMKRTSARGKRVGTCVGSFPLGYGLQLDVFRPRLASPVLFLTAVCLFFALVAGRLQSSRPGICAAITQTNKQTTVIFSSRHNWSVSPRDEERTFRYTRD
jgi:hypothetical protein